MASLSPGFRQQRDLEKRTGTSLVPTITDFQWPFCASLLCLLSPCLFPVYLHLLSVSLCLCLSSFLIPCLSPYFLSISLVTLFLLVSASVSVSVSVPASFSCCVSFPVSVFSYLSPFTSISPSSFPNFSPASQVLCPHIGWVDTILVPQRGHPTPQFCLVLSSCFVLFTSACPGSHQHCASFQWPSPEKVGGRWQVTMSSQWLVLYPSPGPC